MQHASGFQNLVSDAKKKIKEVRVNDVLNLLTEGTPFAFVDVREDDEWRSGRAKGAIHIGKGVIERDIEKILPEKTKMVILYCGGGFRSALAAESIQKMGYTNVISMDGGIKAWRESNLPEEKG